VELDDRQKAALHQAFTACDGLLITAGAGMGVDSGLPDFRGREGFWRAYPALAQAGIDFYEIASPQAFADHPRRAWGFYGHRLKLYRDTMPHPGFAILQNLAKHFSLGSFVFTSNVDGQFQKAGFDPSRILEVHGSIHHLQCSRNCHSTIWPAETLQPEVDSSCCELRSELPLCPKCGALARPNILMFSDWGWNDRRTELQEHGLEAWLKDVRHPLVVEIGAGEAIPTVRRFGESQKGCLIRINPRDDALPTGGIALRAGALEALQAIEAEMLGKSAQ